MRSTILPLAFLSLPALIAAQSSYLYARYAEPEALAYADPYAYADALAYADADPYAYADAEADPEPYAYAEADPYAEANAYPYADPHADAHAELVTILKRWALAYPEALAEPGPPTDPKQAACMREKTAKAHQVEDGDYAAAVKEYNGAKDKTAKAAAARKCQEKARM